VVQDMFLSQSAELAHVVLPAASFLEQEGTFTNTERRVELLRAALRGPEGARPDWQIVAGLLARVDSGPTYPDAGSVFQEITAVVPFYEGLSHARLQGGGIPWPCRTGDPGRCDGRVTREMVKRPLELALPR